MNFSKSLSSESSSELRNLLFKAFLGTGLHPEHFKKALKGGYSEVFLKKMEEALQAMGWSKDKFVFD